MDSKQIITKDVSITVSGDFLNKFIWSSVGAAVFVMVSIPQLYSVSNSRAFGTLGKPCPTPYSKFLHAGLFFLINFLIMAVVSVASKNGSDRLPMGLVAKYSFYATLLFFLVSSSDAYAVTSIIPKLSEKVDGGYCPTIVGVLVHGVVFVLLLVAMMYMPKDK